MEEHFDFQFDFENNSMLNIQMSELKSQSPQSLQSPQETPPFNSYTEERKEDGKKTYICTVPECGKIFKYKSEVTRHGVIHNGNRPYNCSFEGCSKTFKRADALKAHVWIHTKKSDSDEKPESDSKMVVENESESTKNLIFAGCFKPVEQATELKKIKTTKKFDADYFTFKEIEELSRKPEEIVPGVIYEPLDTAQWLEWSQKIQEYDDKIDWNLFYKFTTFCCSVYSENRMLREKFREKYFSSSSEGEAYSINLQNS